MVKAMFTDRETFASTFMNSKWNLIINLLTSRNKICLTKVKYLRLNLKAMKFL